MRWLTNFYDFSFKWTATTGIRIHPTKSWLSQLVISKMQSGCQDPLEEQYAIKFCFKLGKNALEMYGMLQTAFGPSYMNWASVFEWHTKFKEGRESVRDDERCGRSKEVNTPQLIGQRVRVNVIYKLDWQKILTDTIQFVGLSGLKPKQFLTILLFFFFFFLTQNLSFIEFI